MSFRHDYEQKELGEYDCYDMGTGVVTPKPYKFEITWEEPKPKLTYYMGVERDYRTLFQQRLAAKKEGAQYESFERILRDYDNWAVEDVPLVQALQDRNISYVMSSAEWRLWQMLWQSKPVHVQEKESKPAPIVSYDYWFSTVEKRSLRLSPKVTHGETHKVGSEVYSFTYQEGLQNSVPYDDSIMEYLYAYEVKKAKTYCTPSVLALPVADDWLYSLYMHVVHTEDRRRLALTIPKGTHVISYGDRTGSFDGSRVEYYDKSPSRYAIRSVKQASEEVLRTLVRGQATLVLMYVYDLMAPEERIQIRGAQCPVIIWGTKAPPFKHNRLGVCANTAAVLPWLTEELKPQPEFPYSENFSMLSQYYYMDDGPQLRSLLKSGLYKAGVKVHKHFQALEPLDVPSIVTSKGTMVVHSYEILKRFVHSAPYFIPMGRRVDRILTVSRSMRTYQRFTLYHFRDQSQFLTEISSSMFFPVFTWGKEVAGFFFSVGEGVGITITESTIGSEEVWARAYPLGFIIETRRKAYNLSLNHPSFEETFQDMSAAERSALVDSLLNSPSCAPLKEAWLQRMDQIT